VVMTMIYEYMTTDALIRCLLAYSSCCLPLAWSIAVQFATDAVVFPAELGYLPPRALL